jgi:hypothetical protein
MVMQQMMQEQQGDAYVSALQAQIRAGSPRKMLDQSTLDEMRELARSRGINPRGEGVLEIDADDVDQAILFAQLLSHDRSCDLFRGQASAEWIPNPGVLRESFGAGTSVLRWKRFHDWAVQQPQLASIAENQKQLAAVGQHYGIPTYLLDFTRNPRIAAFFATHDPTVVAEKACIFCLWSGALDGAYHHYSSFRRYYEIVPQVERVDVPGLFRMQAQEGSFVYANQKDWTSVFDMDVIRFPRDRAVETPKFTDIYPTVLSDMESLVADYFVEEAKWLKTL